VRLGPLHSSAFHAGERLAAGFAPIGDDTTNYVGGSAVGDTINLEGEHWIVTDAKVLSERAWTSRSASVAPSSNSPPRQRKSQSPPLSSRAALPGSYFAVPHRRI